ncbi:probable inactive serine/threonine-protein kinase slob2 [Scylla paramamosain]|uniref:probable inactive serine/threonine-protein kinase slob2 n=1 Tax=Scylla paramamosain TaxID=85552 RepID=UPI003083DE47
MRLLRSSEASVGRCLWLPQLGAANTRHREPTHHHSKRKRTWHDVTHTFIESHTCIAKKTTAAATAPSQHTWAWPPPPPPPHKTIAGAIIPSQHTQARLPPLPPLPPPPSPTPPSQAWVWSHSCIQHTSKVDPHVPGNINPLS